MILLQQFNFSLIVFLSHVDTFAVEMVAVFFFFFFAKEMRFHYSYYQIIKSAITFFFVEKLFGERNSYYLVPTAIEK